MKYLLDTYQLIPGHTSTISRTPIKYLEDTHQNISTTHIKYHQDTHQISPRQPLNNSRTPTKYLQDNYQISFGHLPKLFRTPNK